MTTPIAQYPERELPETTGESFPMVFPATFEGHDLDPAEDGDLVVTREVRKTQSVLIGGVSDSDEQWSASVRWLTADGAPVRERSATDVGLESVTSESVRIRRTGLRVEVTYTSEAPSGTSNRIRAFVDAHR